MSEIIFPLFFGKIILMKFPDFLNNTLVQTSKLMNKVINHPCLLFCA